MKQTIVGILFLTGISCFLCGGCVAGFSRSHFGTGGMASQPGESPLDDPRYVRMLRLEKEGRAVEIGGIITAVVAGAYLLLAGRRANNRATTPDGASESN